MYTFDSILLKQMVGAGCEGRITNIFNKHVEIIRPSLLVKKKYILLGFIPTVLSLP
jgi:hypothetical protein